MTHIPNDIEIKSSGIIKLENPELFIISNDKYKCSSDEMMSEAEVSENNDTYKTGRWHPSEHYRFIKGCLMYGNNWKKVKECVKTRSSAQIRSHAQKYLIKLCKKHNLQENRNIKAFKNMKRKVPEEFDVNDAEMENMNMDEIEDMILQIFKANGSKSFCVRPKSSEKHDDKKPKVFETIKEPKMSSYRRKNKISKGYNMSSNLNNNINVMNSFNGFNMNDPNIQMLLANNMMMGGNPMIDQMMGNIMGFNNKTEMNKNLGIDNNLMQLLLLASNNGIDLNEEIIHSLTKPNLVLNNFPANNMNLNPSEGMDMNMYNDLLMNMLAPPIQSKPMVPYNDMLLQMISENMGNNANNLTPVNSNNKAGDEILDPNDASKLLSLNQLANVIKIFTSNNNQPQDLFNDPHLNLNNFQINVPGSENNSTNLNQQVNMESLNKDLPREENITSLNPSKPNENILNDDMSMMLLNFLNSSNPQINPMDMGNFSHMFDGSANKKHTEPVSETEEKEESNFKKENTNSVNQINLMQQNHFNGNIDLNAFQQLGDPILGLMNQFFIPQNNTNSNYAPGFNSKSQMDNFFINNFNPMDMYLDPNFLNNTKQNHEK